MLREVTAEAGDGVRFYSVTNFDGSVTMEADKPCEAAHAKLKDISFKLQTTEVVLHPEGYTYSLSAQEKRCQIGIEKLRGVQSEYRLGTVFLRNFYTGLDFKNDMIYIGVNKGREGHVGAKIHGRVYNPFKPRYSVFKATIIVLFFGLIVGGILYYNQRKQEFDEERAQMKEARAAVHAKATKAATRSNNTIQDESVGDTTMNETLLDGEGRQQLDEEGGEK
jgi:hypothetical protein